MLKTKRNAATDPDSKPTAPQPLPQVSAIAPYKQGKCGIPGSGPVIKLSSNESCFGAGAAAVKAYIDAAASIHRYPDGTQTELREAIARVHGINADNIICGNGSEELIGLLIRCFVGEGDELLLPDNHFVMCSIYGKGQGAKIVLAPEKNYTIDVDAIIARITSRTRMIAVANPNNPTGTWLPKSEVQRLIESTPSNVLIILDGAYAEYVEDPDYDAGISWAESHQNVVMTRTFSKIHGLAGLRIGWAYGPPAIIEVINRLRTPFNANGAALAAAAAAIADAEHVARSRKHNSRWQRQFREEFARMGVHMVPSVTNFYLLDFSHLPGKTAVAAASFLEAHGIIPRPGSSDRLLRITIGLDEENQAVLDVMKRYLES